MSWTEEKVNKLKNLWGKGQTASQIAAIIGGVSRNAVIGKAHRLNLSAKIKTRSSISQNTVNTNSQNNGEFKKGSRKNRFRSLLLDKNFEAAKNLQLEDLNENTCKYMEGHPDEKDSSFCGRKTVEKFSYCPLHLMIVFQPKGKKDEVIDKDEEVPQFIEKKVKSA
jgi:GcrA cell cycle regulator